MKRKVFVVLAVALPQVVLGQLVTTQQQLDPIIERIRAIGMDSSMTQVLAHQLFDSLGPRLTGSPDAKRGNDWLVATYRKWGIEAHNEQYGTWRGWRRGYSHIDLVYPRVRSLEATMLGYSPGTGKKNLTASTIIIPQFADSAEFVKWLPNARGKFVLVSAPPATCRPTEDWQKYGTPAEVARMDTMRAALALEWNRRNPHNSGYSLAIGTGELGLRLEKAGIAGIITSRPKDAWGTIEIFETYNTRAPAIAMSCEDYGLLFRLTTSGPTPRVTMNLDAQLLGEQPSFNTIATIRGSEKPNEYVVLSAHFDSWDGSSGATDNGTGTLTMLEAMRILKTVYPKPKRTIIAGHWTGEEQGEVGSKAFTEDHPEVVKGLQALFNQDNGTGRVRNISGAGLPNAAQHITTWLSKIPTELTSQIQFRGPGFPATGGSDDFSFACYGAPSIALNSLDWNYSNYTWHTNRDTYDKVVFDDVKFNATLTAMLAYLASEDPTMITRERVNLQEEAARLGVNPSPRRRIPTEWPTCVKAPRKTEPRLK